MEAFSSLVFFCLFVCFAWRDFIIGFFFLSLGSMDKKKVAVPLVCHGHSRPVVDLFYSPITADGFFLISASKGMHFLFGS